jgi:lysophospholipase L1-like esterase
MKRILAGMLGMCISGGAAAADDARLQAVLRRVEAGEPVTVVAMGGSITTGYAADPPHSRGWAAQVAAWLGRHGHVRFVNAGVSGTDSAAGAQRVQAHVLAEQPDLVFVEYGVNDEGQAPAVRERSYEGLLRQLLAAPHAPAVVALMLTQQGNQPRGAVQTQLRTAAHYGVTAIDFGRWMQARVEAGDAGWAPLYDEPVHPNQQGHDRIAQAVVETLQQVLQAPAAARSAPPPFALPEPLFGREDEFVRMIAGDRLVPWRNHGFVRGGEVHPEWARLPGGQAAGWTTTADDAQAAFLVWGTRIAVFHAESEHYRNLEAWVDDGAPVALRGDVPERRGYLGWATTTVGDGLAPGAHLLHVRVKADALAGSGRPASFLALMGSGLLPPALRAREPGDFAAEPALDGRASDWQRVHADSPRLRYVGRIDRRRPAEPLLAWSGTELRARFTGTRLALRIAIARGGPSWLDVEIDGRRHELAVQGAGTRDWRLREALAPGEHTLRVVKRTEGQMSELRFAGLLLGRGERLLEPPPPRALRLAFYGDSITAGACNGDPGEDQWQDLSTHDGTRAYGALVARRLDADYLGFAVSGIGITHSFGDVLMPQVYDRAAPRLDAPRLPAELPAPDVVLVNLGQNDHGFPAMHGLPFADDYEPRYLAFVRQLRLRYPAATLVLMTGGMDGWRAQPRLRAVLDSTATTLRAEGDTRVRTFVMQAFTYAHPRIDTDTLMADELEAFLRREVLP